MNTRAQFSELEYRLADLDPHLQYLVARTIDVVTAIGDAGIWYVDHAKVLPRLVALRDDVEWVTKMHIYYLRTFMPDVTWVDIGEALGMTRQSARQRFRIEGSLGDADDLRHRRAKLADARRELYMAERKAELEAAALEHAEGRLSETEFQEFKAALQRRVWEWIMEGEGAELASHVGEDALEDLAKQAWYRAAKERVGTDR